MDPAMRDMDCQSKPSTCSSDPADCLPNEILWKIIRFLLVEDLCHLTVCSKAWRNVTNTNSLWLHLCKLRDWERFGKEVDLRKEQPIHSAESIISGTSPTCQADSVITGDCNLKDLAPTCEWKEVYMRAWHLERNWSEGRYHEHSFELPGLQYTSFRTCDARTYAVGDQLGCLRLWNLNSGCLIQKIQLTKSVVSEDQLRNPPYYGAKEAIQKLVLKNGIGVGAFVGGILVFQSTTGNVLKTIHGTTSEFDELHPRELYFEDTNIIASYQFHWTAGTNKGTSVHIWDISGLLESRDDMCTETQISTDSMRRAMLTNNYLRCLACCRHFVITSFEEDETVFILWDIRTLKHVRIYRGHTDMVRHAHLDKDTTCIITADWAGEIKIWTTESSVCVKTLSPAHNRVHTILFNDKGIAALSIKRITFWRRDGTPLNTGRCQVKWTGRINGSRFVTQSLRNNVIKVWDISTGKCLYRYELGPDQFKLMYNDDTKIVIYRNFNRTVSTLQFL